MNPQGSATEEQSGAHDQIPPIEILLTDIVARMALAAHVYLGNEEGGADLSSAEAAIDVAAAAFDRVKERLQPQERLTITQLLTETRLAFVKKRGL